MRVVLLNPPFLPKFSRPQRSPAVTKSGTLYYPLWLAHAAATLLQDGYDVDLIDAPAEGLDRGAVFSRIQRFAPKLLVLDTSTPSIQNDIDVALALKTRLPESFVTLVGTHVSALPEETLAADPQIDAVARREYDHTLPELAKTLQNAGDLHSVDGTSFRNGETIVHNPDRPLIEDLDSLPFVSPIYRKFLKIENYFNPNALYPMVTISSGRGCPFQCIFCLYPQTMMGHRYRLRSIENVVDEMAYIRNQLPQAKSIFFEDDTMTVDRERCHALSKRIRERNIRISWSTNARVDLDLETMKSMRAAGCRMLCVGFESGSQDLLNSMKKMAQLARMRQFMEDARRADLLIHGCFMVGFPGENRQSMQATLDLAKELKPDTAQFYPVMVYPGTEAYRRYKERDHLLTEDYSRWLTPAGLHNTVVRTETLSPEDLVNFCDRARKEFYLRPRYLLYRLRRLVQYPEEAGRTLRAAKTFARYLVTGTDVER